MDKKQAQQVITDLFTQPFNRESYQRFISHLLNQYEPRNAHYTGNYIPDAYKQHIKQYWRIGKYKDPQGDELDLLVVQVKTLNKLERARSALRNFAVTRLKQFEKQASLIAFYAEDDQGADWRFSFVKIEHEAYRDNKGKVKLKQELTPAKRYSYLVGVHENSHTASKQLLPLLEMDYADPRIEEIEAAFGIEKVTSEFFDQYKALFQNLAEYLKSQPQFNKLKDEQRDQQVSRFAKKLLGQIVFLYFLQKKGWLGVGKGLAWGAGSKCFMRERYNQVVGGDGNYYHDFLQYLFYEALADERKGQQDPGYYARFDCRVPFLNGGLFEADYDWKNEIIDLPNALFHNTDKNKSGDVGTGILNVFDRYNFTIKEDEPLEKEVAVDPEMLGKVFENMLGVTERKSKGAFYTPREIVHYMCQESLIHYLDNRLNRYATTAELTTPQADIFGSPVGQQSLGDGENIIVPKEELDILIRKGHLALENDQRVLNKGRETDTYRFQLPQSVRGQAKAIDVALADIKVCDPAIGSGAFPVGLLHEIVNTRLALALHSGNHQSAYELKRHAIAESLYGVDIDTSAIDIARLRLWLSLIVDEEDYDTIEALPNLDYKIVCGDSLVGFPENWHSPAVKKIEQLQKRYFPETDYDKKTAIKQQIDAAIQQRLDGSQQTFGWQVNFDFRLFFPDVWHQKGGFDVVIGNPPYVQIQNFRGQPIQQDWEKQKYEVFSKRGDIYCMFYEKGHRILRERGVLTFITSNKWMRAAYGKKLRNFFSLQTQPLTLIDFSSFQVFETATVDTNVLLFRKEKRTGPVCASKIDANYSRGMPLDRHVEKTGVELNHLSEQSWVISSKVEYEIKQQIEKVGTPLKDWDIAINYGIKTGFNEAFIINAKKKDELIAQDPKSAEIIKPILRGRDIKRYRVDFADLWVIVVKFGIYKMLQKDYPAVYRHLKLYENKLKARGQCRYTSSGKQRVGDYPGQHHWLELDNNPKEEYLRGFEKEKIVWGNLALGAQFGLADAGLYINAPSPLIAGGDRYLLAILNSTVADYYIRSLGVTRSGGYFEYKPMFVDKLPVPTIESAELKPFQILANYILFTIKKEQKLQSTYFEQLIDGLVYELYFPDEIKAANKDVRSHLGELTPITDDMTEEKKLAIIQREFERLYDPSHPVRNNLETLDSVAVVRTIREALKK